MPRNKRSLHKNIKHRKSNKTRKYKLRGGQLEETKSPERELYDSYVNKFVNKYLPVAEREKFPNLSTAFRDYKIEVLMMPRDPLFKTKTLSQKTESIKNVLNRTSSSSSSSNTSSSVSYKDTSRPRSQSLGSSSSKTGTPQVVGIQDVNAGLSLGADFDLCTIL